MGASGVWDMAVLYNQPAASSRRLLPDILKKPVTMAVRLGRRTIHPVGEGIVTCTAHAQYRWARQSGVSDLESRIVVMPDDFALFRITVGVHILKPVGRSRCCVNANTKELFPHLGGGLHLRFTAPTLFLGQVDNQFS